MLLFSFYFRDNSKKQKIVWNKIENNKTAVELYKKLGFKYLGDYDVYIIRNVKEII